MRGWRAVKKLTAEPDKRPKILRLSEVEFSRMSYTCFASTYPIAEKKKLAINKRRMIEERRDRIGGEKQEQQGGNRD